MDSCSPEQRFPPAAKGPFHIPPVSGRRSSTNPASLCLPVRAGADLEETVLEESKIFDRIVAGKERPLSGEPSAGTSDPPWQDQHSTRNLWFPAARFRANRSICRSDGLVRPPQPQINTPHLPLNKGSLHSLKERQRSAERTTNHEKHDHWNPVCRRRRARPPFSLDRALPDFRKGHAEILLWAAEGFPVTTLFSGVCRVKRCHCRANSD